MMKVAYDAMAKAAYIYLMDDIQPGAAARQIVTDDGNIVLDLDKDNRLIGIELLDETLLHPKLKRRAVSR
jgi:uncharacterized protein YuzE